MADSIYPIDTEASRWTAFTKDDAMGYADYLITSGTHFDVRYSRYRAHGLNRESWTFLAQRGGD